MVHNIAIAAFLVLLQPTYAITYTGFLVDNFCVDRCDGKVDGKPCAVDGSNTFTNPVPHLLHCMTDVKVCRESGFSLMEQDTTGNYVPKYTLSEAGDAAALAVLQAYQKKNGDTTNVTVTVTGQVENGRLTPTSVEYAGFVAYTGYLTDNFCVKACAGQFDGAPCAVDGTNTFTNPAKHHVFCMTDVEVCKESGFSLLEKDSLTGFFMPKYTLTDAGNTAALVFLEGLKTQFTGEKDDVFVTVVGEVVSPTPSQMGGILLEATSFSLVGSLGGDNEPDTHTDTSGDFKSQVPGYSKTVVLEADTFWFSWNLDVASTTLEVVYQVAADKVDSQGSWAALGFSASGNMVGSQAVIFSSSANGGAMQLYDLNSKQLDGSAYSLASDQSLFVGSPKMEGKAAFQGVDRFTYKFELDYTKLKTGLFKADADTFILHAFGKGEVQYHGPNRGATVVNLASGGANAVVDKTLDYILGHGFLMLFGWGLCIPSGITSARFLKKHPWWFHVHVGGNVFGLLLATAGFIIALVKFDVFSGVSPGASLSNSHGIIGITVMAAGWLQPFLGLIRPHNTKPLQPIRKIWNLLHWGVGRAATLLAFANIIIGVHVARKLYDDSTSLDVINALIYIFLLGFGVLWICILEPIKYIYESLQLPSITAPTLQQPSINVSTPKEAPAGEVHSADRRP